MFLKILLKDYRREFQLRRACTSCVYFSIFSLFDSFLAGLGRNRVHSASCSAQTAHKLAYQSRQGVLRVYCSNLHNVPICISSHRINFESNLWTNCTCKKTNIESLWTSIFLLWVSLSNSWTTCSLHPKKIIVFWACQNLHFQENQ